MAQPKWRHIGSIGDVDPIAYGGAFVYEDTTGVYAPEMSWIEPGTDEQWHEMEGRTPLQVFRILLERDPQHEFWYEKLPQIATYTGQPLEELQQAARSDNALAKAQLYDSLIRYFGVEELDSYPDTMTEDEAYAKYADEMKAWQWQHRKF